MTATELTFLTELVAGPKQPREIPLARTTRKRIRQRFETRGFLKTEEGRYVLTHAGFKYAYDIGVPAPTVKPYFDDLEPDSFTANLYRPKLFPLVAAIEYFGFLAIVCALVGFLTYGIMLWTGFIPHR